MTRKSVSAKKQIGPSGTGAPMVYRGVRLQPPVEQSRFSSDEITRAIDIAIKKNPDAFARKT